MTTQRARDPTLALLAARAGGATVCPSEAARALVGAARDWREAMAVVHVAVDQLVAEGLIRLSWQGRALPARAGPYRIDRGPRDEKV